MFFHAGLHACPQTLFYSNMSILNVLPKNVNEAFFSAASASTLLRTNGPLYSVKEYLQY